MKIRYLGVKSDKHPFFAFLLNILSALSGPIIVILLIAIWLQIYRPFSSDAALEPLFLYIAGSTGYILSAAIFLCVSVKINRDYMSSLSIIIFSILCILLLLPWVVCTFIDLIKIFLPQNSPDFMKIVSGVFTFILMLSIPSLIIGFSASRIKSEIEIM